MSTATEQARDEQHIEEQIFAQRLEHFRRTWKPEDSYHEREFETALYVLLETAQRVAQKPVLRYISETMLAIAHPIMTIKP